MPAAVPIEVSESQQRELEGEGGGKPGLSAKAVGRALSLARTQAPHAGPCSVRTMARETA